MSAFAPKETTSNSGNHPEAEELAAYIDGVLGPEEASRVTEHLAECADCYHIYSETVEFQLESEAEPSAENVFPFPGGGGEKATGPPATEVRRSSSRTAAMAPRLRWLAAAALVVVGAGLGWYIFQRSLSVSRPVLTVAEVAPPVQGRSNIGELSWQHANFRGGDGAEEEFQRQSFQVGALLVDFRLSAQAQDVQRASEVWRTIGRVVGGVLLMGKDGKRILDEANQIKSVKDLQKVASRAPTAEAFLGGEESMLFPEYLDFGKWTEAGRISALLGNPIFFQREENRQFLSYLLSGKDENMVLEPEIREPLQKIERIWDGGSLEGKDFQVLAESFQAILDQYDFQPSVDDPF
jgi:Putative zinc-finger